MLILTGIVGLAAALIAETLKTSLSTAFIMSGCVIVAVIACLLVVNGRL
jgi:hypothetical protein